MASKSTIGILGLGKMGEAIARALSEKASSEFSLMGSVRREEEAERKTKEFGFRVCSDNQEVLKNSQILIVAVKPQQVDAILSSFSKADLKKIKLIISVCAGLTIEDLEKPLAFPVPVIRAMPNLPALVGLGSTVFCLGSKAKEDEAKLAKTIFNSMGSSYLIEEKLMDAATGLSGCGPAYAYLIIEALAEGGVASGLSRELSIKLAAETLMGSSSLLLQKKLHPAALKDEVTTPAGCTIEALMILEDGKLRSTLVKAVLAAARKSRALRGE